MIEKINDEYVVEYKKSRTLSNGEFSLYLKTHKNNYFFCNCDLGWSKKQAIIRTQTRVSEEQYKNTDSKYRPKVELEIPSLSVSDDEKVLSESQTKEEKEHLKNFRVKYKIEKHQLDDLAQSIKSWADESSISSEAISMMHKYLVEGYRDDLTDKDIKDIIIYLLEVDELQYEEAFKKKEEQEADIIKEVVKKETKEEGQKIPEISIDDSLKFYGQVIEKSDKVIGMCTSKIGGVADLPEDYSDLQGLESYYFVAQINTSEMDDLPEFLQNKLISIFQPKPFEQADFYKALPAKLIVSDVNSRFKKTKTTDTFLEAKVISFKVFDAKIYDQLSMGEQVEWTTASQSLTRLYDDDYAEVLVTASFSKRGKSREWILPELENTTTLKVLPLLRISGSDLKLNGERVVAALNIIYFAPTTLLKENNADYCYFVAEPFD